MPYTEYAFPVQHVSSSDTHPGLTVRDYFAAGIMKALILAQPPIYSDSSDEELASRAALAYRLATAMINARRLPM